MMRRLVCWFRGLHDAAPTFGLSPLPRCRVCGSIVQWLAGVGFVRWRMPRWKAVVR
jgi:hypothetical protein